MAHGNANYILNAQSKIDIHRMPFNNHCNCICRPTYMRYTKSLLGGRHSSGKPEPTGRNFTRIRQLRWHAITLQIFGALDLLNGHKMAAKTLKQQVVSPTSQRPIFFQFEHKTWNGVVMNSFGIELRTFFPIRDYLPTETSILGCLPTDFRCTARIPAFAFRYLERIWALHFIG